MNSVAAQRLVMAAVTLLGVATIVFVLLRVVPGDPIAMMISPGATPADIAALRAHYGLDASLPVQFLVWVSDLLRGDFGTSISLHRNVLELLGRAPARDARTRRRRAGLRDAARRRHRRLRDADQRLRDRPAGRRRQRPVPRGARFHLGASRWCCCSACFCRCCRCPGRIDPGLDERFLTPFYLLESLVTLRFAAVADVTRHMIMPTLALGLPLAAVITRVLEGIACARRWCRITCCSPRLKGMSRLRLVLQEALRNAIAPTLALTGVQFTFLIGGTVIVERIFAYPGIGNMAIDAVINRDLPLIQGLVLVFGALFIVVNMIVDLLVVAANPRLRNV